MEKSMVLWQKTMILYWNYGTLINKGKNHGKTIKLWFIMERTMWVVYKNKSSFWTNMYL